MMGKRLFVALGASEIEKEAAAFVKKVKVNFGKQEIDAQWTPPENWHITLHFLGMTEAEKIPEIKNILSSVAGRSPSLKLKISDFGAFPDSHQARVVWMGVQRSQDLLNLQGEVEAGLSALGFAPESRDYWPHLTVARLRNHQNIVDALSPVVRKKIGVLEVQEMRLYESTLAAPYPRYQVLETFAL